MIARASVRATRVPTQTPPTDQPEHPTRDQHGPPILATHFNPLTPPMDPLFSGSIARQRQINLGGTLAGPSSTTQLAAQARRAREAREALRQSHVSAGIIQRYWRGARVRGDLRRRYQDEFSTAAAVATRTQFSAADASAATRSLIAGVRIYDAVKGKATSYRGRDSPREDELLRQWCATLTATTASTQQQQQLLFLSLPPSLLVSLSREVEWRLRLHATRITPETQVVFLNFLHALWTAHTAPSQSSSSSPPPQLGQHLIDLGQYSIVPAAIAALTTDKRSVSPELGQAVATLLLAPFAFLPAETAARSQCIAALADQVFQLPTFRSLPVAQLGRIGATMPILELAEYYTVRTSNTDTLAASNWRLALDNFSTLGNHRLAKWNNGKAVATHLDALTSLQNAAAIVNPRAPPSTLMNLTSVTTALAISNQYPASTRPALHRHLLSLLACADSVQASQIANAVLYGGASSSTSATTGPVREIWRGYIRGTPLARALGQISNDAEDISFLQAREGWEALLLLCELYSRVLGTLADDEFMPLGSADSAESSSATTSGGDSNSRTVAARNPLSMDEVRDFAALVRNLAFVSYWHVDAPVTDSARRQTRSRPTTDQRPQGVIYTYSRIRDLSTRMAQQLRTRDTRHRFASEGFWSITAGLDISEYLDWILQEDERLTTEAESDEKATEAGDATATTQGGNAADGDVTMRSVDDDGEGDDDDAATLAMALGRPRAAQLHSSSSHKISARQLAIASPRLGVLNNLPFVIPFHTRVDVFNSFVSRDARRLGIADNYFAALGRRSIKVTIRRDHVAEDGMEYLNKYGSGLKRMVYVTFLDQFGIPEPGVDGGGLFKEFLTSLAKEAFDTDRGLWRVNDKEELYPNPSAYARQPEQLEWYKFLGRIVGKGLYDGILVDLRFAPFFLSKLLGRQQHHFTDDLALLDSLDPELYRGLLYLKNYTGDVENDLSLNFTVTDDEFGERKITELVHDGSNVPVTRANRIEYIHRVARYRLDFQIRRQSEAFLAGVSDLINPRWLRLFDQVELQELIKGADSPIDVDDLRDNIVYSGYHPQDLTIDYFWQAMESFDQPTRAAVLRFITSCPSPPLLGFKTLNPKVCIQLSGEDEQRLPTSSTCVNLLKLPRYSSFELCRDKLLTAVKSGAGFDLA